MEAIRSSEKTILTGTTRYHISEDGILHSQSRQDLKSETTLMSLCDIRSKSPPFSYSALNCHYTVVIYNMLAFKSLRMD
jgi:hypothetical protein